MRTSKGFGRLVQILVGLIAMVLGERWSSAKQATVTLGSGVSVAPFYENVVWRTVKVGERLIRVSSDYLKDAHGEYVMGSEEEARHARAAFPGTRAPSPAEVDAIWRQADIKLAPITMTPTAEMIRASYQRKHQALIEEQMKAQGVTMGDLVAGHKKDVVRPLRAGRTTIYGWHRLNGNVIQPESSVHDDTYSDYSQGIRLVRDVE